MSYGRKVNSDRNGMVVDSIPKKIKLCIENDTDERQDDAVNESLARSMKGVASDPSLGLVSDKLLSLEQNLCVELRKIEFRMPVEYVYSPIEYAYDVHSAFVQKYCNTGKRILFLGMNPGPWGMSQTGVPFGEITMVRDWLRISGPVGKPDNEQPDRKVTGFDCTRSEVSGKRFWSLFQSLCGSPEKFFRHAYLHNYCPIALMDKNGRNITPAELKGEAQKALHSACDRSLTDAIQLLNVEIVIGIGRYAEKRAQIAIAAENLPVQVLFMPHPSPRALHNENWQDKATKKLDEFGLLECFTK